MLHWCVCPLARSRYLIFFFTFFQFYSVVCRDGKVHISAVFLFFLLLLTITMFGRLAEIRWSICMSKFHRSLCVSFSQNPREVYRFHSPGQILGFAYTIFSFGQIPSSSTIHRGSPSSRSCVYYYYYYYYYSLIRVFHIRVSLITGVWVTASLLKSPGLFSVFWPFSIM